ncbi:hypothetical protein MTR67_006885 [Solanum verrucosum]|uniref:Uncharacterized protein n=1 Tax=Solanum verrucosum TaxID=315347 RepID=A0AAF0Q292_SOLVR|nr:hypothetical protein MTR67_006885 [Solanum verrucosum]
MRGQIQHQLAQLVNLYQEERATNLARQDAINARLDTLSKGFSEFKVVNPIPNKIYDATITLVREGVVGFTDAGLQREKEKTSIGMAAIDSCGHLLHAVGTPIQFVGKAITVEALAIREAVERALQKEGAGVKSEAKEVEEDTVQVERADNVVAEEVVVVVVVEVEVVMMTEEGVRGRGGRGGDRSFV